MRKVKYLLIALISMPLSAGEYEEIRDLTLDASNLNGFIIDATSGLLDITGNDGIDHIIVKATIKIETSLTFGKGDAVELAEKKLTLKLDEHRNKGKLTVNFDESRSIFSNINRSVDLEVQVPSSLFLKVVDGSGWIKIANMNNGVNVDDGSGYMELRNLSGDVDIEDGSGHVLIDNVSGNINLDDGSGSITISNVQGEVNVEDGSGGIEISNIVGSVIIDDGSGSINVNEISNDFILKDDGSGSVSIVGVHGDVRGYHDRKNRHDLK